MSFWTYQRPGDPAGGLRPDEETIGSMLRDLHAVLRRYPRTQTYLTPLQDIPAYLARRRPACPKQGRPPWPPPTGG